jgi:hypothetical protein
MLKLDNITFPLYKLGHYLNIEKTPLGAIIIQTIKQKYILDDLSLSGNFEQRRLQLYNHYSKLPVYKLKEQILYLRQLVKYPSKTKFIDNNGKLFEYKKGKKFYKVYSHRISKYNQKGNWGIIYLDGLEQNYLITQPLSYNAKYASIMYTDKGYFLYDLTKHFHKPYRRKL